MIDGTITIDENRLQQMIEDNNKYHIGDTVHYSDLNMVGYANSGSTEALFDIYLPKQLSSDIDDVTITYQNTDFRCNGSVYTNIINTIYAVHEEPNIIGIRVTYNKNTALSIKAVHLMLEDVTLTFTGEE